MKILVPKLKSSKGCDSFTCDIYECRKHSVGKKKKRPFQKVSPQCGRYWCGQVTIPGEET